MSAIEVLRTGPLSLIEDLGRAGYAALGVGLSGAADRSSYEAANALLGNDPGVAAIECLLGGLSVKAVGDITIAVTGAPAPITIDGIAADHAARHQITDGQVVKLGTPKIGLRSYLAVAGGLGVPEILGSRSRDTLSGIGPDPLARGDRLPVGPAPRDGLPETPIRDGSAANADTRLAAQPAGGAVILRAIAGPRADWFVNPDDLAIGDWIVSPQSNRVGVRLDRSRPGSAAERAGDRPQAPGEPPPALRRKDSRELASEGLVLGSVQVPPSGQPVLFLADHPVTGGYPVVAVVRDADIDLASQFRPGQRVRFELTP